MNESSFKKSHKFAACTMPPWYNLIPKDIRDFVMRKIRQETIEAYGYSMDECPKRKTCLTKNCIGRPLPFKSETARPYLEKLRVSHKIENDELFISNCDSCPIAKICKSPCHQVNDFLNRASNREADLIMQDTLDNHVNVSVPQDSIRPSLIPSTDVPWDCLTDIRQSVVKKYLYEGKDFYAIAKEMDLNNQARVKYEFYSALTRLSEFAVMRKFIVDKKGHLNDKQLEVLSLIYEKRCTLTQAAEELKISKQAVQQLLTRVIKANNIKWTVFVKKHKNKIIYNVPGLFK